MWGTIFGEVIIIRVSCNYGLKFGVCLYYMCEYLDSVGNANTFSSTSELQIIVDSRMPFRATQNLNLCFIFSLGEAD